MDDSLCLKMRQYFSFKINQIQDNNINSIDVFTIRWIDV